MGIYRVFAGGDGESHMEELRLEEHSALGALTNIREVRVQQFDGTRQMDFHPLPERRLIIHLSGEVEIGTSDGSRHGFRIEGEASPSGDTPLGEPSEEGPPPRL